jgi:N-acetylglucosaminyl-diphospho-decaprenol L-rhamnosyltransferase
MSPRSTSRTKLCYDEDVRVTRPRVSVIVVSYNSADWLRRCLPSVIEHAGCVGLEIVVVDSGSTDDTAEVASQATHTRLLRCENRGFAYANNRALLTVDSEWILFLNPDTEIVEGTLGDLVATMQRRPGVGVVGVRQETGERELYPTIRRFPTASRYVFEALGSERFPFRASCLGERELDVRVYQREVSCDWMTGSFLLARREALLGAGFFDERFFLYCEEADLCLRIRQAGWEIRHIPQMTIIHHANKAGWNARLRAQEAYARAQYVDKHLSGIRRVVARTALSFGYGVRALATSGTNGSSDRHDAEKAAFRATLGLDPPPFLQPPGQALTADQAG